MQRENGKIYKPNKPIKGRVEDWRCHEINEEFDLMEQDFEGDGSCLEDQYDNLFEIDLETLLLKYSNYDPEDIYVRGDVAGLSIYRPETDKEFRVRLGEYEIELEKYNRCHKRLSPEEKEQKKRQRKADKVAKLLAEARKIQEELENDN